MRNSKQSKTSLFLMELIITIMFFAICSGVCVQLFVQSHVLGKETWELNRAVEKAQGFAEVMRGTDGTIESIMAQFPEAVSADDSYFEVFYDVNFLPCEYSEAVYVGDVTLAPNGAIQNMDIRIVKLADMSEIYTLTATKYMIDPKG